MAGTEPETNLVTYLELRQPPRATKPWPGAAFRIVRLERPSVRFYRYLYATVGEGWFWELRKRFDAFMNERCKGKDATKLRFVIE